MKELVYRKESIRELYKKIMVKCPKCGSTEIATNKNKCCCWNCSYFFEIEENDNKTENEKLKIFLSYGHTESEICREICSAMERKGYEVWFDEHNIQFDDNWRLKITEGINSSNGVIACLSQYSVRNPGVCRNEIRIALALKGGNVKTILLEDEKYVQPPAEITHNQWLDMHDWKSQKELGEKAYQLWFDGKMSQLFSVLENKENLQFSGQINNIQKVLKPLITDTKSQFLLQKDFYGRQWLTSEVIDWVENSDNRICVLYGDPGIGKSAFMANFCALYEKVMAYFFCEHNKSTFNSAREIIKSLAYQLACKVAHYRWCLDKVITEYQDKVDLFTDDELFENLLVQPLNSLMINGNREVVCIIIDGLDECGNADKNAMAAFLSKYVKRLPLWIKFVVSSRRVNAVKKYLTGASKIEIIGDGRHNIDDIKNYLELNLKNEENKEELIDCICKKSQGIFLYAELIVRAYKNKNISGLESEGLPDGIEAAFFDWFSWIFEDEQKYKDFYRAVIGLIIISGNPLPVYEIPRLIEGWDENTVNDFIREMEPFLTISSDYGNVKCISFSHKYVQDWLEDEGSGCYHVELQPIGRKLVEAIKEAKEKNNISLYEAEHLYDWTLVYGSKEDKANIFGDLYVQEKLLFCAKYFRDSAAYEREKKCYLDLWEIAVSSYATNKDVEYLKNAYWAAIEYTNNRERMRCYQEAKAFIDRANDWFKNVEKKQIKMVYPQRGIYIQNCKSITRLLGDLVAAKGYCKAYVNNSRNYVEAEGSIAAKYELAFAIYDQIHLAMEDTYDVKQIIPLLEEGIGCLEDFISGSVLLETQEEKRDVGNLLSNYATMMLFFYTEKDEKIKQKIKQIYEISINLIVDDNHTGWDKRKVAEIYYKYGTFMLSENAGPEWLLKAYEIAKENYDNENTAENKTMYIVICRTLCNFYMNTKDYHTAEEYCDEELALHTDNLTEDGLIEDRRGAAYAYQDKGKIQLLTERIDEGISYYKKSFELQIKLICQFNLQRDTKEFLEANQMLLKALSVIPDKCISLQIDIGEFYYRISESLKDVQWFIKATYTSVGAASNCVKIKYFPDNIEKLFEKIIDMCQRLYNLSKSKYDEILATSYMLYGEYLQHGNRIEEAIKKYSVSFDLFRETAGRNPSVAFYVEKQAELFVKMGDCMLELKEYETAKKTYESAKKLYYIMSSNDSAYKEEKDLCEKK